MCRLTHRPADRTGSPLASRIMSPLLDRVLRPLSCVGLCLLAVASTGCAARTGAIDAEVERLVEREDRRQVLQSAVAAAADLELGPIDLASARVWVEALGLVVAPAEGSASEQVVPPIGAAEGWDYQPPASWMLQPLQFASAEQLKFSADSHKSDGPRGLIGLDTSGDGEDGKGGKPKLLVNLLRMRINNAPVSFSGSVKGFKGVQLKATIKM